MGAEEPDRVPSLGMRHLALELECASGEESGGVAAGPGDGDPGNDSGCNFDDEWATVPDEREDDNSATGETACWASGITPIPSKTGREAGSSRCGARS